MYTIIAMVLYCIYCTLINYLQLDGRPGSSVGSLVTLTRWDVASNPGNNTFFLAKK